MSSSTKKPRGAILWGASLILLWALVAPALASHPLASLAGSNFEIDVDANLKVDHTGRDDWASVTEIRNSDAATGWNDDSYAGGAKEDDACPGTTTAASRTTRAT
jgi:hypothetical protein